ncbi:S-layer homology domain-containing protein [Paenibacillus spongiae]|uniref:S-layer homology domain-containing protein n=1 Tax=Paenibacillus spongiae TaxID=2909671 RepID=A0ABY5S4P1_9BACL|nr:S-layer homology domain-containing protein [Paenibacillus spongiae]UVI27805.1 S-layer homology domain-containing protein [Paenibacillus spongiae]
MHMQNKWKRMLSSITILALLLTGAVSWGQKAGAEEASASSFSDVAQTHWASKHIAKLALQGIVKGYNGQFKPNDNVTQQEAIVMAIRFIGKEDEVGKADSDYVYPATFKVGEYFKPYVEHAMRLKLIDQDEEFKLAEADPSTDWGTRKASREWVTKLIVRAIGEQKKAEEMAGTPSSFTDSKDIGSKYAGYVNAGVSLQLIKGVAGNKFDPKGFITRASIATIFSRAESIYPVAYAGQLNGVLTSKTESSIGLYSDKTDKTYTLTSDSLLYRYDSEKAVKLDDIALHTDILLIADSAGKVLYLEQMADTQKVEKLSGTVARVIPSSNVVWLAKDNDPNPIIINYDNGVVVKDSSGATIPVADLSVDSMVEITRDTYRDKPVIISITVQSAPVNKNTQGVVTAVKASPASITVALSGTGPTETYSVTNPVDIIWQGTITQDLSQVQVGDTVSLEIKASVVTKITVQQTTAKTIRGQFYSASTDSKTIQFVINGKLEAKFVTDIVNVQVEGLPNAGLADLLKDDQLELTLNDKDQVTAVKVLNRKIEVSNGAIIVSYDADLKALIVRDAGTNKLVPVYLTDRTKIENYGVAVKLEEVASLLTKNRKVSVGYAGDKAIFLEFVFKYSGTVTSLNASSGQLSLALTNGSTLTIPLAQYVAVEILGKSNATLSDVKVGSVVSAVMLNNEQDRVNQIQVHTTTQHEIVSVDTSSKKVRLKNIADLSTVELSASTWELYNELGEKISIGNLSAGQIANLTYIGTKPASLKLIPLTVGRIASISPDKVSVTTTNGTVVDVALGSTYSVVKNGITSGSAANLQAGDRVDVRKDTKDQVLITVNSGVSRKYWKYDAAANEIYFKRLNINDNEYKFKLTSSIKILQGETSIPVSQLKDGDQVQVYFSQGVLLEIVKVS